MRRLLARHCARWRSTDSGAMAVLLAVVLTAVAIPVSGYGVTQLVRNGLQGELQRAADQGALAGSAMIPLADVGTVKTFLASTPSGVGSTAGLIPSSWCTKGPVELGSASSDPSALGTCALDIACRAALASLSSDRAYGRTYAVPYGLPTCTASYADDLSFFTQLATCTNAVTGSLLNLASVPTLTSQLTALLGTLGGITSGLAPQTPLALGSLLPALLHPGVSVSMSWLERGPLDALTPSDNGAAHTMTRRATAKRAFKNLVVVPTVGASGSVSVALQLSLTALGVTTEKNAPTVTGGSLVDLNPALVANMTTVRSTLSSLDTLVGSQLPACAGLVGSMTTDVSDILDPQTTGAPTATQVLTDAAASDSPSIAVIIPTITSALQIPFLDFVPVCMAQIGSNDDITRGVVATATSSGALSLPSGVSSVGSCTLAAPGLFRGRLTS